MSAPGHRYRAWGWDMLVPMPVPELPRSRADAAIDWQLHVGLPADGTDAVRFTLPNGAPAALVSSALALVGADRAAEDLHPSLLRAVVAVALRRAGRIVLHAAAIEVDGRAVMIAGKSGAGKTMLAATLCSQGGRLLGDELCAVTLRDGQPTVWPGSTLLALHHEAVAMAGITPPGDARLRHGRILTAVPWLGEPLPPRAICLLEWDGDGGVVSEQLTGAAALKALLSVRYQPEVGPPGASAGELPRIVQLAAACPVWRITRARSTPPSAVAEAILRAASS